MPPREQTQELVESSIDGLGSKSIQFLVVLSGLDTIEPSKDTDYEFLRFLDNLPKDLSPMQIEQIRLNLYPELDPEKGVKRIQTLYTEIYNYINSKGELSIEELFYEIQEFFMELRLPLARIDISTIVPLDALKKISKEYTYAQTNVLELQSFIHELYLTIIESLENAIAEKDYKKIAGIFDILSNRYTTDAAEAFRKIMKIFDIAEHKLLLTVLLELNIYIQFLVEKTLEQSGLTSLRIGYLTINKLKRAFNSLMKAPDDIREDFNLKDEQ